MIIRNLIEHNLKIFNELRFSPYNFYKSYDLALQQLKFEGFPINHKLEKTRRQYFAYYIFGALKEAIENSAPKQDNESDRDYNRRIRKRYFLLRKKAFSFLQQKIREDYSILFKIIQSKEQEKEIRKLTRIDHHIVAVWEDF